LLDSESRFGQLCVCLDQRISICVENEQNSDFKSHDHPDSHCKVVLISPLNFSQNEVSIPLSAILVTIGFLTMITGFLTLSGTFWKIQKLLIPYLIIEAYGISGKTF